MDNNSYISLMLIQYKQYILWACSLLLLFFNIGILNQSPEKYSNNKLLNLIPYKYVYIGIFLVLFLLDIYEFRHYENTPTQLWVFVLLLVSFILHHNTESKIINKDGTFNLPPKDIKTKNRRIKFILIALFILIAYSAILYKYNSLTDKNMAINFIRLILLLFILYKSMNYNACSYNLPISWNN